MKTPTLTEARRALLELMENAQPSLVVPSQFGILSMYLDSQVPLNVESFSAAKVTGTGIAELNKILNLPGMNDLVNMDVRQIVRDDFLKATAGTLVPGTIREHNGVISGTVKLPANCDFHKVPYSECGCFGGVGKYMTRPTAGGENA